MFAKPTKKPVTATAGKSHVKPNTKPKTVGVKSGIKVGQGKRLKPGDRAGKQRAATRADAGYSLYSTDSEDQVAASYREVEACEKILTHLKHKQKAQEKPKRKGASCKKAKETVGPRLLNPSIATSSVSNMSEYGLPYGAERYLRQHYASDLKQVSNPLFNLRLSSSTPDPEKHLSDSDPNKLPGAYDETSQDVPVRDISAVSSIPPSLVHLRNMADLVGIYKNMETNNEQLLCEEATRIHMEQIQQEMAAAQNVSSGQNLSAAQNVSTGQNLSIGKNVSNPGNQCHTTESEKQISQGQSTFLLDSQGQSMERLGHSSQQGQTMSAAQQIGQSVLRGTGSLGFLPSQQTVHESSENSSPVKLTSANQENPNLLNSSLTAFQPYLCRESLGFLPPQHWMMEVPHAVPVKDSEVKVQGQSAEPASAVAPAVAVTTEGIVARGSLTNQSEKSASQSSSGTDYAILARSGVEGQIPENDGKSPVIYQKQNGLYQIRPNGAELQQNTQSPNQESPKAPSPSPVQTRNSVYEIPERDTAHDRSQASTVSGKHPAGSTSVTFNVDSHQGQSINTESTESTPRNQTTSSTASTCSQGKIVFIPNSADGASLPNTQNVIGYFPGVAMLPGTNQPISWPVAYEVAPNQQANQTGVTAQSSILGNPGQHSQQTVSQDTSGSGYHSAASSQAVAAGDVGVRKLRYLLKELQECNRVSKDTEINRLVGEIDSVVDLIPQLATTFNLHTEIDLAIQPLRSENSQLRRKLRLTNQQLKDKEQEPKDINFQILHLETSNAALQKVVREEKEVKARLAAEVQLLHSEMHKLKVEKSRTIANTSEKDTEQLKLRQESLLETRKLRHDVDLIRKEHEVTANRVEVLEKENHILQITLQQRDAEIERQQTVIDTMKENIAELLHELDHSRSAEKTWDHNTSFGLNKLLRIVEEETTSYHPPNRQETARKVAFTQDKHQLQPPTTDSAASSAASTPRLTRMALAYHDRKHSPPDQHDWHPTQRQGPASESEVDTLIERSGNVRKPALFSDNGKHRRTNSASPVRAKNGQVESLQHQRSASSPMYAAARLRQIENRDGNEITTNVRLDRERFRDSDGKVVNEDDRQMLPPQRRVPLQRLNRSDPEQSEFAPNTEVSVEQSRYSVTDYFRKYPSANQTKDTENLNSRPPPGREFARELPSAAQKPGPHFQTSSEIDDGTHKSSNGAASRNIKQRTLFKGTDTISAIHDDDNISSVSMSSISTANTADDRKFRSGIATLDSNIAKLQLALQKTKSMLS